MTIFITYTFLEGLVKITPFKTDGFRLKSWLSRLLTVSRWADGPLSFLISKAQRETRPCGVHSED